jgi:hypothetical protein
MLTLLLISVLSFSPPAKVYICQGSASYAYHSSLRCDMARLVPLTGALK